MPVHSKHPWLIGYDIAQPRRLQRIHRRLIKEAYGVQYSLYLFYGSVREAQALLDELAQRMDPREDDLRAYPVPRNPELYILGSQASREGLGLYDPGLGELVKLLR